MKKTILLWDIDGTLLNFVEAEKTAIRACFQEFKLGKCSDEMLSRYSVLNKGYWEMLERGEIEKEVLLVERFRDFFSREGLNTEVAGAFNELYQGRLGDTCIFMDQGLELIKKLKDMGYKQYIVTNGTKRAQKRKLEKSGLGELIDDAFISDELGAEKPFIQFFEKAFEKIGSDKREEMLIIGDSLTSDIKGGNNAGIETCYYNPGHNEKKDGVIINYEIDHLWKLLEILKM